MRIRRIGGDELDEYVAIRNALTPGEHASAEQQRERLGRDPRRLHLLAETAGEVVGCGFAGPSDSPRGGFLEPKVLPSHRRGRIGSALLWELAGHLHSHEFETASSHVDGKDDGSLAFARRFGFVEIDRQVEQVRTVGDEPRAEAPPGLTFVSIAERPDLLREAYDLAREGYADLATSFEVVVSLEDWLRDEATCPDGSFVALSGNEVVGYAGLLRREEGNVENGLTVVRRAWRRRGVATALKRAGFAWAAGSGFREIVTWTQRGNEGMRAVNERLGYVYRSVSVTVRAPLPLSAP